MQVKKNNNTNNCFKFGILDLVLTNRLLATSLNYGNNLGTVNISNKD